jgi:L-methionine (R)-S-oxide reductase
MFTPRADIQGWLEAFVAAHGGTAGTVHLERGGDLHLAAAKNIPPPVVAAVELVPHGKGMAGVAQVRRQPTQTCNLKTDDSGTVKPGAKAVDARAAIALPVLDAAGEVRAVVGIAFDAEGEIAPDRERGLMEAAAGVPR